MPSFLNQQLLFHYLNELTTKSTKTEWGETFIFSFAWPESIQRIVLRIVKRLGFFGSTGIFESYVRNQNSENNLHWRSWMINQGKRTMRTDCKLMKKPNYLITHLNKNTKWHFGKPKIKRKDYSIRKVCRSRTQKHRNPKRFND